MGISIVASGIHVTLAGASSVGHEVSSRQKIIDNGDAAALDCLELQWTPSGPLALFFSKVRVDLSPALGQKLSGSIAVSHINTRRCVCVSRMRFERTMPCCTTCCG